MLQPNWVTLIVEHRGSLGKHLPPLCSSSRMCRQCRDWPELGSRSCSMHCRHCKVSSPVGSLPLRIPVALLNEQHLDLGPQQYPGSHNQLGAGQDQLHLLPFPPWVDGDRRLSLLPTCTFPIKPAATEATSILQLCLVGISNREVIAEGMRDRTLRWISFPKTAV